MVSENPRQPKHADLKTRAGTTVCNYLLGVNDTNKNYIIRVDRIESAGVSNFQWPSSQCVCVQMSYTPSTKTD